jgi:hypothetical protein
MAILFDLHHVLSWGISDISYNSLFLDFWATGVKHSAMQFILPTFFGIHPTDNRPKLKKWHAFILQESDAARNCYNEVWNGLEKWWDDGRWEKLGMKPLKSGRPLNPMTVNPSR